jgi:hypothetical protein
MDTHINTVTLSFLVKQGKQVKDIKELITCVCCTVLSILLPADTLGLTAHDEYELAVRALGACTWYLKESYLDQQLLFMGRFELYQPRDLVDTTGPAVTVVPKLSFSRHMASIETLKYILVHKLPCTEKSGSVAAFFFFSSHLHSTHKRMTLVQESILSNVNQLLLMLFNIDSCTKVDIKQSKSSVAQSD